MRIAVSGTHCSGKTTLIDAFLIAHPDFAHEPEPYTVLVEDYGEDFPAEPVADDFFRQLEFNVDRLSRYQPDERVIYERSPVDFLAYILALKDLQRDEGDSRLVETALGIVAQAIRYLDVIVFLPLDDVDCIEMSDSEDPELRSAVDCRLVAIFGEDELDFVSAGPLVLEARGATARRLQMLEDAMGSCLTGGIDG
jgi:predicted ATPase